MNWSDYSFGVGLALGLAIGGMYSLAQHLELRSLRKELRSASLQISRRFI